MAKFGSKIPFLLMIFLVAGLKSHAQPVETYWDISIEKLRHSKSTFYLALSAKEKEIMAKRWAEIGESLKAENTSFDGTYAKTDYEWGYFLRFSREKGYILMPYFDQNMIADFSYGHVEITKDS